MKTKTNLTVVAFSLVVFLSMAVASLSAQTFAEELRPFDFSDRFYEENGIIASTLIDRKNGADGESVIDTIYDPRFRNVRITATLPAYTSDGAVVFWNHYADASRESFAPTMAGGVAVDLAYSHPMYVFPSTTMRNSERQAAMIKMGESYFDKNLIGMAAVFLVEYTDRIFTKSGRAALQLLAARNGLSLDGTPIIKTAKELESLSTDGLVTIRLAGPDNSDRSGFAVAKVLQNTELGAIAPDAFLIYVKEPDGKPLAAEAGILALFECLQSGGMCS